jgi:AcrR family transcriptional regulator
MPAKPKTSHTEIVAAALALINEAGADNLSMLAVAQRVGVRGPSLYKHFVDRAALLKAAEIQLFQELGTVLADASAGGESEAAKRMAFAYRAFAKRNPRAYALMFASVLAEREAAAVRQAAALPVLELFLRLFRNDFSAALSAARTMTAFCHGFVSMELADAFRLGGGIDHAFAEGIEAVLAGIAARAHKTGQGLRRENETA